MRRREFISLLDGAAAWPLAAGALRWLMIVAMTAGLALTSSLAAEPVSQSILFFELDNQARVWNFALSNAFHSVIDTNTERRIYSENLDFSHFSGPQFGEVLRSYLRDKYRGTPIGVIVVPGPRVLEFVQSLELWPGVPVVVAAIDGDSAAARLNVRRRA